MKRSTGRTFDTIEDLFLDQIRDLHDAESRLSLVLPRLAGAAKAAELSRAFRQHLDETLHHIERLNHVLHLVGAEPAPETSRAMQGLIHEADEIVDMPADGVVKDAALIAAAQRIEHYEISAYGSARIFAHRIGRDDLALILQSTLDEEATADQMLACIAERALAGAGRTGPPETETLGA